MAVLADIGRRYMIEIFANRIRAIVAAEATTRDIGMIDICG
jgi:hypothetical protein